MALRQITFEPAVKEATYLRLSLIGTSGSGKSWTALTFATHLAKQSGGKIAVIDTEGRSARKYADHFAFDVFDMSNDYNPATYIQAIKVAEQAGYHVLVIDSLSHAWNGAGGVLEIVDQAGAKMGNNKFAGWSKGRPAHNNLINAILNARIHIIGTLRSKTEWALDEKNKPQKVGLSAVQDGDFEYEFDVVGMMDMQHHISISKSRCTSIPVNSEQNDIQFMAETLYAWLTDGVEPPTPRVLTAGETYLNEAGGKHRLVKLLDELAISKNDYATYLSKLGLDAFGSFVGTENELHTAIAKIHGELNPPATLKLTTLDDLRERCQQAIAPDITDAEIAKLAGVDNILSLAGMDLNLQFEGIQSAFEKQMQQTPPAQPKVPTTEKTEEELEITEPASQAGKSVAKKA